MNTLSKILFIILLTAGAALAQADGDELQKAIAMYRQGSNDQAIKVLEGLSKVKNFSDAATVQNYLGLAYLEKDELKKARKAFSKAIKMSPQNAVFRTNLALAHLRNNKIDLAQSEVNKAIRLDPQLYTAYYVRGTAFLREGKYSEAVADASRSVTINADFPAGYSLKAEALTALFGKHVSEGSTPKSEIAQLGEAVATLESCVKNCKAGEGLSVVNEKLESLKVFYEYFSREEDKPAAVTPVNPDDPNRLKIIAKPRASYTDYARRSGISGRIVIAALFAASGRVTHTIILKPLGYGLDQEALKAARGISFTPAVKDGKPVSVVKMVEYTFTIY